MYTLIGAPRSRAFRVMWMLEELGEYYEHDPAPPRSERVRAVNPDGKIPVLMVGGEALTQSVAIVQFLADRHGRFTAPAGALARARQDAVTQFCVDEIEGALWTAAKNSFVHPEDVRVPEVKRVCRVEFAAAMATLDRLLGDRPFVAGEDFTVPDLLIGHCAGWATMAKFDRPSGRVGAYVERLRARPAFAAAMRRAAEAA